MEWDRDPLRDLRVAIAQRDRATIGELCAGRELDAVVQLVGDALLDVPESALACECVERLRRRGFDRDAELADALDGRPSDLRPLAVDLEELASILDGDPVRGGGRIDLATGDVWPASPNGDPVDADDEDPERWLWVEAGSRDGWRDMAEFAGTVSDSLLAERLDRAIHRSGAFRRFRRALRTPGRADALPQVRRRARPRARPPLACRAWSATEWQKLRLIRHGFHPIRSRYERGALSPCQWRGGPPRRCFPRAAARRRHGRTRGDGVRVGHLIRSRHASVGAQVLSNGEKNARRADRALGWRCLDGANGDAVTTRFTPCGERAGATKRAPGAARRSIVQGTPARGRRRFG
jgi:hypothetical protein